MHSPTIMMAQEILSNVLIILLIGTIGGRFAEAIRIPDVVIYILIGLMIGPIGLGVVDIKANSLFQQVIILFGASFILYHGGTLTQFRVIKKTWRSITLLSTIGVVITANVIALAAYYILHIPYLVGLLLGSILASTDPAALIPIFRKFPIRPKVAQTVITESAFTDATGAIMTTVVLGILTSEMKVSVLSITGQFFVLAVGGIIVGIIVGGTAAFLISNQKKVLLHEFTPVVITVTVIASYLLAEWIHASGFMSVFVAGLMLGNASSWKWEIKNEVEAHQFIDAISLKLRMLIFVLLGVQVDISVIKEYWVVGLAIVLIFVFIARPITVLASLLPDRKAKWTTNEILFFFWKRETGVIAAALVGIVGTTTIPQTRILFVVTFIAILITLFLQATSTPYIAKKLNLTTKESENKKEEATK